MIMRSLLAFYFKPATTITYMLQNTEYEVGSYLRWYWRTQDFSRVMHRRTLDRTRRASLLLTALRAGMGLQITAGLVLTISGLLYPEYKELVFFGLALLLSYPIIWAHLVVLPLLAAKFLIVRPKQQRLIATSERVFAEHPGARIAVAGSYGKTTMKEMLATVLGESMKIAATPANKNVAISHAQFAQKLDGDEAALIIEYGEGEPGDVERFADVTHPTHAIITGLAPAHLDKYKTLQRAGEDIFSVAGKVPAGHVFVNAESADTKPFIAQNYLRYSAQGIGDWKVSGVQVGLEGTNFTLSNGSNRLHLKSGLLGRHQIGPLSAAAILGLQLGLTDQEVEAGVAKTVSFEHRMRPYRLGGACIIDDTYNGNLEGIRAGTQLLKELEARRKWYVTPGLVDQGEETARVHHEVGRLIAAAAPDTVVLMKNSVTEYIQAGLKEAGYRGEVRIESDPLAFYTSLEHFVAKGDLVLMQNDWTDNYA